jgi:hypothetical protein
MWVRSSLRHLSFRLRAGGHPASPPTVSRLLKSQNYALHVNAKKREASAAHPQREEQFAYLAAQREAFTAAGWPIVSVDTKKKELIGNFRNAGRSWSRAAEAVNVRDFPQDALGRAVPYGIYDLRHNRGTVCVVQSGDTPRFAVTAVARWWEEEGRDAYAGADQLLILADSRGSNGWQPRLWKQQLQEQLSDRFGLTVTVCHYPTGCSKWNPIEQMWPVLPLTSKSCCLTASMGCKRPVLIRRSTDGRASSTRSAGAASTIYDRLAPPSASRKRSYPRAPGVVASRAPGQHFLKPPSIVAQDHRAVDLREGRADVGIRDLKELPQRLARHGVLVHIHERRGHAVLRQPVQHHPRARVAGPPVDRRAVRARLGQLLQVLAEPHRVVAQHHRARQTRQRRELASLGVVRQPPQLVRRDRLHQHVAQFELQAFL